MNDHSAKRKLHEQLTDTNRQEQDTLLAAMHQLEAALATAAPHREQAWTTQVAADLGAICEALTKHVASAEGPHGLYAEIDLTRPTLARRVERLRQEHVELVQQARALRTRAQGYGPVEVPNFQDLRQRAERLLNALRFHHAAENDLIFESFFTDIGVGD